MVATLAFGVLCGAGASLVVFSGIIGRRRRREVLLRPGGASAGGLSTFRGAPGKVGSGGGAKRSVNAVVVVQVGAAMAGGILGWTATGLLGMAMLLGGLGVLLPPFMAAPARRRRQTRQALAWSLWSRQLAELARAGSGLLDSIKGSVEHAPPEVAPTVRRLAATAEMRGIDEALREFAVAGKVWEPEVAAGLRVAASSGGAVAGPLLDLCGRIADVVALHRLKTEAVVELWTQTIALLSLAGGVVTLMYRNNPAYFEPYEEPTGQMVFVMIAGVLLLSTGFLVFNSVVRSDVSVLVAPRRRSRAKAPL